MVRNPVFINLTYSFTGGAYLALSLVSFFPYSQEKIQKYLEKLQKEDREPHFLTYVPWSPIIGIISYILFFLMDKILLNKNFNESHEDMVLLDNLKHLPLQEA